MLPFVTAPVRAVLELLALTGMRPSEACSIKPSEIDTEGAVWIYRPTHHKTKWRGKERVIPLGARARAVLARSTSTDITPYFGTGKKRKSYSAHTLGGAVRRACKKAAVPAWHPNQLRHLFATQVRKLHGLEAAQALLGHSNADTTQIYAERNLALAAKVAAEIG